MRVAKRGDGHPLFDGSRLPDFSMLCSAVLGTREQPGAAVSGAAPARGGQCRGDKTRR